MITAITAQLSVLIAQASAPHGSAWLSSLNSNIRVGLVFGRGAVQSFRATAPDGFIIGEVRSNEPYVFYAQRFISANQANQIEVTLMGGGLAVISADTGNILHEHSDTQNNLAIIAAHQTSGGVFPSRFDDLSSRTTGFMTTPANNIYPGAFIYQVNAGGTGIEVINLLCLEDYLKGVVPAEVPSSWEAHALKAFAITARSYSVHSIIRSRHTADGFDICNATHCQLFIGLGRTTERTNAAVSDTRGLVMTFEGRVIEAVYHSSSGGATENHNDAWGGIMRYPFLSSVRIPYENYRAPGRHNSVWTNTASPIELFEYLTGASPQAALFRGNINSPIADIRINERSPGSNYIRSVTVIDSNGNAVTVETSSRVRSAFAIFAPSGNMDIFRSSSRFRAYAATAAGQAGQSMSIESGQIYIISADGTTKAVPSQLTVMSAGGTQTVHAYSAAADYFVFDGRGWGHGVGLSQWGSQDMALAGHTYDQIVKTFFTGVSIARISDLR